MPFVHAFKIVSSLSSVKFMELNDTYVLMVFSLSLHLELGGIPVLSFPSIALPR